jgi:hypothetical protein
MKELFIKDKKAHHVLRLGTKEVEFINGKATVSDDEAREIRTPEYVVKDVETPQPDKPKRKRTKKV